MKPGLNPDLVEAIGWLKAAYTSYRVEAATIQLYASFLADLPAERVAATIRSWIANEPKFPTVADIRLTTIRRRIGAPPAYEAFNQVKSGKIKHDLVQHAYDTIGGKFEWERDPKFFPSRFIKLYGEIVDREVREFNEFSLTGYSDYEADRPGAHGGPTRLNPGGGNRGGHGLVLVGDEPGRSGNRRGPTPAHHAPPALPADSLPATD